MNPLMISFVFISLLVNCAMTRKSMHVMKHISFGKLPLRTVLEGENFFDICLSPGYPPDKVYWENEAKTIHCEGRELNIKNISRTMSGTYTCYGKKDSTTVSLEAYDIEVQYPAKILFWNDTENELHVNDSFDSIASVEGNPLPTIDLISTKQQQVIVTKHGEGNISLTVTRVQCEDTGTYELHCSNKYNSDTMNKVIYVFCAPYINPDADIRFDMRPRLGESAIFTMSAAGYPMPSFTWTHDGKEIKHEDKNYTSTVNLTVSSVEEFGEYQLEMRNSVGGVLFKYHLIPEGPPERPKGLKVVSNSKDSVTLSWISGYDYNNTQTFVVMKIEGDNSTDMQTFDDPSIDNGQEEITGTINYLKPYTLYNLTVKAVNKEGEAESGMFVHFVIKDKHYSFTIIIVSAVIGFCVVVCLTLLIIRRCRSAASNKDKSQRKFSNVTSYGSGDEYLTSDDADTESKYQYRSIN